MTKTLMIVGTSSSVGKSLLVAAFCRIFAQSGVRVAPFKAQNMSLNSFATRDGKEIGRAQAMQAQAAGIEPAVEMNPILLKPEADSRSQVVVLGKPWATLQAADYYTRKMQLWEIVTGAFDRLSAQYDLIVIEGAGSAVEPNFRSTDIVNMRLAMYAHASTLLAGDIDKGGVFGALLGTLELMAPDERALVRGFLINKFRGDRKLLEPALTFITERTGVPVLGVIPHLGHLQIADEDSVAIEGRGARDEGDEGNQGDRGDKGDKGNKGNLGEISADGENATRNTQHATRHLLSAIRHSQSAIDIAVIRLPHIANFDDFDALAMEEGVRVRFVGAPDELRGADAIILPGTKTTIADLLFLNETGLAAAIGARARQGATVAGICGGYQMLGRVVRDPLRVESPRDAVEGLGLLPVETWFEREKATEQVTARVVAECGFLQGIAGETIHGYEIHMGRTDGAAPMLQVTQQGERTVDHGDGAVDETGRVFGTYLHGIFDNPNFRRAWLNSLRPHATSAESLHTMREREYDRLAAAVQESVDMDAIREMVGA